MFKVFSGLAMLASKDQNYKGPKDIKTAEQMVGKNENVIIHISTNVDPPDTQLTGLPELPGCIE